MLFLILNQSLLAQEISYSYDANGNRLIRCVTLRKSTISNDSLYEDEARKEIFKEEIGEMQIRIYPNPTKGDLIVEVYGLTEEEPIEVSLYNSTGTMLKKLKFLENQFRMDFNSYPSGIYVLKLNIEGKTSEWKIIKE
jgi:hypothetical protein